MNLRNVRHQDHKRLDQIVEVIFTTWIAIYGRSKLKLPRNGKRCLRAILWLVETASYSGVVHLIKTIKEWAGWCRKRALTGDSTKPPKRLSDILLLCPSKTLKRRSISTMLLQAAFVGRAMPEGGPELDKSALDDHYRDLRRDCQTTAEEAKELTEAGAQFVKRHKFRARFTVPSLHVTAGATLTSTRGDGGLANDVAVINMMMDKTKYTTVCPHTGLETLGPNYTTSDRVAKELVFYPDECVDARGQPIDYSGEPHLAQNAGAWQNYLNDYLIIRQAIEHVSLAWKTGRVPLVKREIVRELGYKVRIVTKAPATLQIAGGVVRRLLLSALREWSPLHHVLHGNRYEAIRQITKHTPPATGVFVSTDLSKATDKVSSKKMIALWEGIAKELGLGVDLVNVGKMCLGPVCICDSDICEEQVDVPTDALSDGNYLSPDSIPAERLTCNGILMGNPLTWLMLNVSQAICVGKAWETAIRTHKIGKEWEVTNRVIDHSYSVCGDDLIAYWPTSVAELYEIELGKLGFVTNTSKHYISSIGGVFTEIPFFGKKRKVNKPLHQVMKPEMQSVTRVALAHMPYNTVVTARPDPADPVSRRLITVQRFVKSIDHVMAGIQFPGCFPIRGMLKSTTDHERAITIGETSRVLSEHCDKKRLSEVLRFLLRDHISLLHRRGVVPEFPQSLGGAGYWFVNTARRKCIMHRKAVASLCYGLTTEMDGGVLSRKWQIPQRASGWWAMAEESAKADLYADSAFRLVKDSEMPNLPKLPTGILKRRTVRRWQDERDPEALTSVGRLFGHPNPLDRVSIEEYRITTKAMRTALERNELVDEDETNGLYNPDRLVLELALEYEKTFIIQMGPTAGGPGYKTCIGRVCTQLRKQFKELVANWPQAKPVTNWEKAEAALRSRMTSTVAVPAVYSYEPQVGDKQPALLGWHTSAARRGVYATLNWGRLLTAETSVLDGETP